MSSLKGHKIEVLDEDELKELRKYGDYFKNGALRIYPEKILFPLRYLQFADDLYSFQTRPQDVMVMGYLKTGTTWMQEIIWNMINNPNLDKNSAQEIYAKSPYLEIDIVASPSEVYTDPNMVEEMNKGSTIEMDDTFKALDWVNGLPDRRVLKSHFVPSIFRDEFLKSTKVIYTVRDPKDVFISYFHHYRMFKIISFKGNMAEFLDAFISGNVFMGDYPNHIRQWWPYRNHENVLFVYYENLKKSTLEQLKRIDRFLGTKLSEVQLEKIKNSTSFEEMKKNATMLNYKEGEESEIFNSDIIKETGGFYRKGIAGSAKDELDEEINRRLETYLQESLDGINLPYEYLQKYHCE